MRKSIVTVSVLTALNLPSFAQVDDAASLGVRCLNFSNENPVSGSARFSGMAGANTAIGQDISAASHNPAGIGLFTELSDVSATPVFRFSGDDNHMGMASGGGAFILSNRHKSVGYSSSALAISYHQRINLFSEASSNKQELKEDGRSGQFSATYGMNIANRFYWGLGLNIISGHFSKEGAIAKTQPFDMESTTNGFYLNVGGIVRMSEKASFGVALQSPTRINVEETNHVKGDKVDHPYTDAEYHLWAPLKLSAGLGWYINDRTTFDIDYSYQDFSAMNVSNSYDYFNDVKDYSEECMKASHTIKAGLEFTPADDFKGRLGVAYQSAPTQRPSDDYLAANKADYPTLMPHESLFATAGIGYEYRLFKKILYADVAYIFQKQNYSFFPNTEDDSFTEDSQNDSKILLSIGVKF